MARWLRMSWLVVAAVAAAPSIPAARARALGVTVDHVRNGGVIPPVYAFCVASRTGHTAPGPNRSPAIAWSHGPAETRSYAIVMVDTDAPTDFATADKEGAVIPAAMTRRDFYHWVLVDIPPGAGALADGADSAGPAAKPAGPTPHGVRGLNGYGGGRAGYDGPCPPWNDAIAHHYHIRVYALDVAHLALPHPFAGTDVMTAIRGHVLARGEIVGLYTQNPDVARTLRR
jgi:Raf kinase inhibitor-like YbhB/YbcL family protein